MTVALALGTALCASFALAWALTRALIVFLQRRGWTGVDLHKDGEVQVTEMAGLAVLISLLTVTGITWPLFGAVGLALPLAVIAVMAAVGFYDDLRRIRGRAKYALSFLLSAAVLYLLPLEPSETLSTLLPAMLVPAAMALAVSVSANAVNILAGFNGLESGTTAIASTAFLAMALASGNMEGTLLSAALLGACLGFLWFNRYPARAFPGDVGTLTMGGALALAALLVRAEVLLPLVLAPHIIELLCKLRNRFAPKEVTGHARLGPDGNLMPGPYAAFVHFIMRRFPSGEKMLVWRIWAVEAGLSAASFVIYLAFLLPMEA